jgi:hypothetical protein
MNKEHFQTLLEDLYIRYNHTKKSEVQNLVEKYNGQEFDAIKTFYFKYNFRSHPNYDPKAGSDTFIKNLIEQYSNGQRLVRDSLNSPDPEEERSKAIQKQREEASSAINDVSETKKEELLKVADEKMKLLENIIKGKEHQLEEMIQSMDKLIQEKAKQIEERIKQISEESLSVLVAEKKSKEESEEHIELKINLDYLDTDIELPKEVSTMAAGTRFLIIEQQTKKMLAFEIKDIFCDYVSVPGKCIKEINIQRI